MLNILFSRVILEEIQYKVCLSCRQIIDTFKRRLQGIGKAENDVLVENFIHPFTCFISKQINHIYLIPTYDLLKRNIILNLHMHLL